MKIFGAVSIEGPKWCGKTWTSLNHSNSVIYMTEKNSRDLASIDPKYIFKKDKPQLIDEWQIVPSIWDSVRNECDSDHEKGKFILTGSTSLLKEE
ncbi:MAG: AAA family ATPase [Bacilli bacterium]|nr:AAA family ATPase [Bacilli bacterium]